MDHYIERVVDLLEPSLNRIHNMTADEARQRLLSGKPEHVREIDGSFALLARDGKTVRMARSLDRPMRYFLAKRHEGPALIVADRIDAIYQQLKAEGLDNQFHPSYTRMVPAHHVVEIQLVGCPDPDPTYTRFFTPQRDALPTDLDEIGRHYIGALADEIAKWLRGISSSHSPHPDPLPGGEGTAAGSLALPDGLPTDSAPGYSKNRRTFLPLLGLRTQSRRKTKTFRAGVRARQSSESIIPTKGLHEGSSAPPVGVCFSGGIDSGSVFLVTYHVMRKLGISPSRLKAFTLDFGDGPDFLQAREFLGRLGLGLFLEPIEANLDAIDVAETISVLEDYKPLDVECASMGLTLCRGIRAATAATKI